MPVRIFDKRIPEESIIQRFGARCASCLGMELVLVGISLPLSLGVAFLIQKMALAALLHCLAPAINPRVFAATRRRG